MSAQTPLSSLSARGISALKALLETLEEQPEADPDTRSLVSSLLTRFKLWVGNLGAHRASGTRSLEYKLRDASILRNHIISLLQELCLSIDEAFAVVLAGDTPGNGPDSDRDSLDEELEKLWTDGGRDPDDRTDLDLALSGIRNAVDNLLRLSAAIRNPASHDHFKSKIAAAHGEIYEPEYKRHVSEKYNHLEEVVVERLAKSMARRRQYFKYREEHASRIAEGVEEIGEGNDDCDDVSEYTANQTTISSLPGHLKDEALAATAAEMADVYDDRDDVQSQASETSYATTNVDSTEFRVPRPPPGWLHGPFECPFCHMIISVDSRHQWKKHVFRDLQPYNCLYQPCRLPYRQFSRRSHWIEHMRREHWRVWHCSLGCANATFDSAQQLIDHNKYDHGANLESSSDEDGTTALSSVTDISKARGPCPLCLEVTIANDKIYGKHVGNHLERLALFVLPRTPYGDSSDEEDGLQDDSNNDDDDNDGDDGADGGGINNNGQPTNTTSSNEVKPPDSSKSSHQQRQPDGPMQEPGPQQADRKRMDWETYLHRKTGLPGDDDLENDMYNVSLDVNNPGIILSRNRTRDPDAPPTYTAAAIEAEKKGEEEEEWKKKEKRDRIFGDYEAQSRERMAASMEEMNRNMFNPVIFSHQKTRETSFAAGDEGDEHWTGPHRSPPTTASGSGQGTGSGSGSYANMERDIQDWSVYGSDDDNHHSPAPSIRATQVTQDTTTNKGKKKEGVKQPQSQGLISSLFSKKEKPPQRREANIWAKPEPSRRYSTWSDGPSYKEGPPWQEEEEENERSGGTGVSGGISSFFSKKKK